MMEADGMKPDRLFVALDFQSLDVAPFEIEYIDRAVREVVETRFGAEWKHELYRIYPGGHKDELMGRMRWLRRERKIRKWRLPRHRGRRPPPDWDYWIGRHAVSWCVREKDARRGRTVCVLVSNGGSFEKMLSTLQGFSVEVLVMCWGAESEGLKAAVGTERLVVRESAKNRW